METTRLGEKNGSGRELFSRLQEFALSLTSWRRRMKTQRWNFAHQVHTRADVSIEKIIMISTVPDAFYNEMLYTKYVYTSMNR